MLPPLCEAEVLLPSSPHPLDLLVRTLQLHAPLGAAEQRALRALSCTVRTLEAQSYIVREGDPPTICAVLVSGFAYRQKLTSDGARQIVSIQMPGDPLDLQNMFLDVADHSIQTLTRAEVAFIPRGEFETLARTDAAIGYACLMNVLVEASISREWVLNVGRRDSRARMAHLLCEFAVRLEAHGLVDQYGYDLPMTQELIADATGLTSVHVNRTLKGLEAEGLIARNKRKVSIPDWEALRDVGDFNLRYLHLEPSRPPLGG